MTTTGGHDVPHLRHVGNSHVGDIFTISEEHRNDSSVESDGMLLESKGELDVLRLEQHRLLPRSVTPSKYQTSPSVESATPMVDSSIPPHICISIVTPPQQSYDDGHDGHDGHDGDDHGWVKLE